MRQPGERNAEAFTVEPGQSDAVVHDSKGAGGPLLRDADMDRAVV
jgi:hypothetical protein